MLPICLPKWSLSNISVSHDVSWLIGATPYKMYAPFRGLDTNSQTWFVLRHRLVFRVKTMKADSRTARRNQKDTLNATKLHGA